MSKRLWEIVRPVEERVVLRLQGKAVCPRCGAIGSWRSLEGNYFCNTGSCPVFRFTIDGEVLKADAE